mmetsp:Transcript_15347/g.20345  ORF Transcript_15347/g.20345 Transcript_15347/m.20345 type:complete len:219 (-) Transcript_15347:310-966(-)
MKRVLQMEKSHIMVQPEWYKCITTQAFGSCDNFQIYMPVLLMLMAPKSSGLLLIVLTLSRPRTQKLRSGTTQVQYMVDYIGILRLMIYQYLTQYKVLFILRILGMIWVHSVSFQVHILVLQTCVMHQINILILLYQLMELLALLCFGFLVCFMDQAKILVLNHEFRPMLQCFQLMLHLFNQPDEPTLTLHLALLTLELYPSMIRANVQLLHVLIRQHE